MNRAPLRRTLATFVGVRKRSGVDHVGIGRHFNYRAGFFGFEDESESIKVTRELMRRGNEEAQIAKTWSGDFLRVFEKIEAVSSRRQRLLKRCTSKLIATRTLGLSLRSIHHHAL